MKTCLIRGEIYNTHIINCVIHRLILHPFNGQYKAVNFVFGTTVVQIFRETNTLR